MLFKELAVKNYGNIAKAKIDLDYQGLTFIFGKNKDSGPDATNGAGKSQFWTALPELAYSAPPSGKDGYKHKDSKIRLTFEDKGHLYTFTKAYNKSGSKSFTVTKDGKDINVRTLDYAQKKLQEYMGKTEEDFYTRVYIDSLQAHPLIVGSAAQRQEFFVRMFNLQNVDSVRKLLLAELSSVQKVAAQYREVKALFESLQSSLKTTDEEREQLTLKITKLRKERDSLLSQVKTLQKWRDLIAFESDNKKTIDKFLSVSSPYTYKSDVQDLKDRRKKLRSQREAADEWKAYRKLFTKYKAVLTEVDAKVQELLGKRVELELLKEKAKAHERLSKDLEVERRALEDYKGQLEDLDEVEKPKYSADEVQKKVTRLADELEHVHEFKNGKCPTCGSKVDGRPANEVKEELSKWQARLKQIKAYERYVEKKVANDKVRTRVKAAKREIERLEELVSKTKKWAKAYKLTEQIPEKPEKPNEEEVDADEIDQKIEAVTKRLAFLESVDLIVERIDSLNSLTAERRKEVKGFESMSDRVAEINVKLGKMEAFKNQQDEVVSQLKTVRDRGKLLKKQAGDEPLLKALVEAYSTKGLKKFMIQRYATALERQVNKFVRFTFNEDFSFEFKYDTKLEVLVHRKYGKKVKTSDVKRLSGAEKKMFTLLLVIATYTMTPKNKRPNLLVLDELEANMGPSAVQSFMKALPVLNKIVPHIVVITPRPELGVEGARAFTAVKYKGVTSYVEGRV